MSADLDREASLQGRDIVFTIENDYMARRRESLLRRIEKKEVEERVLRQQGKEVKDRPFIDKIRVTFRGGDGGSGCLSMRRSRQDRQGKADGGYGGTGGDVFLKANPAVRHLADVPRKMAGGRGGPGKDKKRRGFKGEDMVIDVPLGTVVTVMEGTVPDSTASRQFQGHEGGDGGATQWNSVDPEALVALPPPMAPLGSEPNDTNMQATISSRTNAHDGHGDDESDDEDTDVWTGVDTSQVVLDLSEPGQVVCVAKGGAGGRGSAHMPHQQQRALRAGDPATAMTSQGEKGSSATAVLELKLLADVGLVGFPNAGKSSLLRALTRARPRIGSYAFTTLRPQLGTIVFDDMQALDGADAGSEGNHMESEDEDLRLTVSDIPGLIEGAHENKGLGHQFLRHIQRTKLLVFVLDMAPRDETVSVTSRDESNGELGDSDPESADESGAAMAAALRPNRLPVRQPWEQLQLLVQELEQYQPGLALGRRAIVAANKMDEPGSDARLGELLKQLAPGGGLRGWLLQRASLLAERNSNGVRRSVGSSVSAPHRAADEDELVYAIQGVDARPESRSVAEDQKVGPFGDGQVDVYPICAVLGEGIDEVKAALRRAFKAREA